MAFISSVIGYLIKMVIILAGMALGLFTGKKLKDNKDAKAAQAE